MTTRKQKHFVWAGVTRLAGGGASVTTAETLGGVFRLEIGDNSWQHLVTGLPDPCHVFCITPSRADPDTIFIGTHDGPYRSCDRGASWQRMDFPQRSLAVWSIATHPTDPRQMLAGTSPIGVWRSEDGGASWRPSRECRIADHLDMGGFKNRVMRLAIDPSNPHNVAGAAEVNGVVVSRDGGETWRDGSDDLLRLAQIPRLRSAILTPSESEGMLDTHAMCATPAAPGTIFLACRMGIFASRDWGATWEDLEVGRFSEMTYGRDVRLSPHDPNVLIACLSVSSGGNTGSVCRSDDLGRTWRRIDHTVRAESTMMAVAPHPEREGTIFAAARHGQVLGTQDNGRTWAEYRMPSGCKGVYAIACT